MCVLSCLFVLGCKQCQVYWLEPAAHVAFHNPLSFIYRWIYARPEFVFEWVKPGWSSNLRPDSHPYHARLYPLHAASALDDVGPSAEIVIWTNPSSELGFIP